MNKNSIVTFPLEFLTFLGFLFFYIHFWKISYESIIFLIVIFLFSWFYCYQRSVILLEYYTHIIRVSIYFLLISFACVVALRHINVFWVGLCTGLSWLFVIIGFRFILIRLFARPYQIIIHPALTTLVSKSRKVNLIIQEQVAPEMLKNIQAVIIDRHFAYNKTWKNLIIHATQNDIIIFTYIEYNELIEQRLSLEQLNENWMRGSFSIPLWYLWLRNLFEFLLIVLLTPFFCVLILVVGFIILITMGKPIFYTQYRVGKNDKPFKIYKFRSMIKTAEKNGPQFTMKNDTRITRVGAFMRKHRIDESPQFINILKGDMSLIGPRPEQKSFVDQFNTTLPLYKLRRLIKPGITGWSMVNHGYANNENEMKVRLQYDLYYVKHVSFILDLKIILRTIFVVLTGFKVR